MSYVLPLEGTSGHYLDYSNNCRSSYLGIKHFVKLNLLDNAGMSLMHCLSLKAGGPFYLVSMPGEVKDPTQG